MESKYVLKVNQRFLWPCSSSQTVSLPEGNPQQKQESNETISKHHLLRLPSGNLT